MKKILLLIVCLVGMTVAHAQTYTIYPIPQRTTEGSGTVELTPTVNVVCGPGIGHVTKDRIQEVLEAAGYTCQLGESASPGLTNLYVGVAGSGDVADAYATSRGVSKEVFTEAPNRFDAHVMQIADGNIVVLGNGERSEYYAFATLEQILDQAAGTALHEVTYEDYSHCQWRGAIEGFYGNPYSVDAHCSLFEFFKRFKMNVFIYAPKMDPYHLGYWTEEYPTEITEEQRRMGWITQDDVRRMAETARACNVHFVWAAHPGLAPGGQVSMDFSNTSTVDAGVELLMEKYHHMYDLGVRAFSVCIDDMDRNPSAQMQAHLPDQTQKRLKEEFPSQAEDEKIAPLFYVPATYALMYSGASSYLSQMATVDKDVVIGFTGYAVCGDLDKKDCDAMAGYIERNPLFWWNATVNDNNDDRLYMRELTAHYALVPEKGGISTLGGVILNPEKQAQAAKVGLFGLADYCWNPDRFDVSQNWYDCFDYLAEAGDTETAEQIRLFARYTDAIYEDQEIIDLYEAFKSKYSAGNFPAEGTAIREEMARLQAACEYIETVMANSENSDYRLFATDVKAWCAKIKAYAIIIQKSLDLLENGASMSRSESWSSFASIISLYTGLGIEPQYFISELEGYGTDSHVVGYEVHPANSYTRPFVDYLYETLGAELPGDWPAPEQPQVVTNLDPSTFNLTVTEAAATLTGLSGVELADGDYVGLYLGSIEKVTVEEMTLPEGVTFETSINGKIWTPATLPVSSQNAAYVRLVRSGADGETESLGFDVLTVSFSSGSTVVPTPTISSNLKVYTEDNTSYPLELAVDGNTGTFFWSGENTAKGHYIQLDYGDVYSIDNVTLVFTGKDILSGTADIQLSTDGSNWNTIAQYSHGNLVNNRYTCAANGANARYVRLMVTSVEGSFWIQLAEFSCTVAGATAEIGTPTPSTSLGTYQSYNISNVVDGNTGTHFWSNTEPQVGDWLQLEYAEPHSIFEITVTFMENDQLIGSGEFQVSLDGQSWTKVAAYDSGGINANTHSFTTNANGATGKYLRLYITNIIGSYWLKVAEFGCVMADRVTQTTDHNQAMISALSDKNMITNYRAEEAGYVEHTFIENMDIEAVEIYHNTTFDANYELPAVSLYDGSQWVEAGTLDHLATVIDTRDYEMVTAVRIEWNEHNIPTLYEIIPSGEYKEPQGTGITELAGESADDTVRVYTYGGRLVVSGQTMLSAVRIYDLYGRLLHQSAPDATSFTLDLGASTPAILVVQVVDESGTITTAKVVRR